MGRNPHRRFEYPHEMCSAVSSLCGKCGKRETQITLLMHFFEHTAQNMAGEVWIGRRLFLRQQTRHKEESRCDLHEERLSSHWVVSLPISGSADQRMHELSEYVVVSAVQRLEWPLWPPIHLEFQIVEKARWNRTDQRGLILPRSDCRTYAWNQRRYCSGRL
jgi:hypothetical protein